MSVNETVTRLPSVTPARPARAFRASIAAIALMALAAAAGAASEAARQHGWPPFGRDALAVPGGGSLYGAAKVGLPGI
jgi:hypothetical protein